MSHDPDHQFIPQKRYGLNEKMQVVVKTPEGKGRGRASSQTHHLTLVDFDVDTKVGKYVSSTRGLKMVFFMRNGALTT
ncbi:MAG: hypothetical protein IT284_02140 [Bacteroidetes bacterium]|nr:hypothetical protein [Bacteroidota bacterium]